MKKGKAPAKKPAAPAEGPITPLAGVAMDVTPAASQEQHTMSSTPNPARIAGYREKLADLIATRNALRDQGKDHKVKDLNRQIEAQLKWIKRAEALEPQA